MHLDKTYGIVLPMSCQNIVIASDIHGSLFWTRRLLEMCDKEGASQLVLLGDILYHGARNPLPKEYNPQEVATLLNPHSSNIVALKGNCDSEVDSMVLDFPLVEAAFFEWDGHRMVATHGHKKSSLSLAYGDILLFGHTHLYKIEKSETNIFFNPGSISLPKEGQVETYGLYSDNRLSIKDFNRAELLSIDLELERERVKWTQ